MSHDIATACSCVRELQNKCGFQMLATRRDPSTRISYMTFILEDPDFGRMAYTVSILLMFSLVILLLMLRSIKRSSSGIEMEALLEAMRFREELDLQERQRRRLMKAKTKVTAWLTRTNDDSRGWKSSPALMQQRWTTSSTVSEIPRVVVTAAGDANEEGERSRTPCLSLMYDFTAEQNESSPVSSSCSFSLDIEDKVSILDLRGPSQSLDC